MVLRLVKYGMKVFDSAQEKRATDERQHVVVTAKRGSELFLDGVLADYQDLWELWP